MKKRIVGLSLALWLLFAVGAGAAVGYWINFKGDDQITQSSDDLDEIMQILRDTHAGKLSAEKALKELEALNPPGLAKQNKELREKNDKLVKDNTDLAMRNTDLVKEKKELQTSNENLVNTINKLEKHLSRF